MDEGRCKAQQRTLAEIEKKYGKGTLMKLGDKPAFSNNMVIPTGALSLDLALGIGGLPRGRIVEIFGPESSGKSTVCQHVIAEAQRLGGAAAYIDAEHALDPEYAQRIGVKVEDLYVSQPDSGEQGLDIAEDIIRSGGWDVVVIDSVAALTPRAELDGDIGDSHVGLQARLMSQAMRKLTAAVARTHVLLIFTNQLREKVGVMFGNPEITTGGKALKFYASVRIDLRRTEQIKAGANVVGARIKAKIVKNKVAPPFRTAEFEILFDEGISKEGCLLDLGAEMGVIRKSGAFFFYGEQRLGQGREVARAFLRENRSLYEQIDAAIRQKAQSAKAALHVGAAASEDEGQEAGESF